MASIQKMPVREKLIELLNDFPVQMEWHSNEELADYLIANGVKIPVLCKDCKFRCSMDCPLEAYVPWVCTGDDGYCADGIRRNDGSE